jgi:arginase family enzyme
MNNGRPGAAEGPKAFRAALSRYGVAKPAGFVWPRVFDAGDVAIGDTLDETHLRVTEAAMALLDRGLLPVMIGGGHDLTFPFVRGAVQRRGVRAGIYLDAHLDVREEPGSGMPFRRLIEDCGLRELRVHGLDRFANSESHVAYFHAHGGRIGAEIVPDDVAWPEGPLFLSIDLDVVDQAYAPGVSAGNPCGWTPDAVAAWAFRAGTDPRVEAFDIMELCPAHDEGGRTARLAARLFVEFLRGVALRDISAMRGGHD